MFKKMWAAFKVWRWRRFWGNKQRYIGTPGLDQIAEGLRDNPDSKVDQSMFNRHNLKDLEDSEGIIIGRSCLDEDGKSHPIRE